MRSDEQPAGVEPSLHLRSLPPGRIRSGAKCPSHQRKTPQTAKAPAEEGLAGWNIQTEPQGRTSVPPAEVEEERSEALCSGREQQSAQRATSARPARHPPNFGRL